MPLSAIEGLCAFLDVQLYDINMQECLQLWKPRPSSPA